MWKECKVVMLPTNEKAKVGGIYLKPKPNIYNDIAVENHNNGIYDTKPQHLYIISDEEIKEGDWCYEQVNNTIYQENNAERANATNYIWKVIATTDTQLTTNISRPLGVTQQLPSISQSFITHYITEYNKGNVISKVMIEYDEHHEEDTSKEYIPGMGQPAIKIQELLVNSDNTINIKSAKDSYTRDEHCEHLRLIVIDLFRYLSDKERDGLTPLDYNWTDNWIKNNL